MRTRKAIGPQPEDGFAVDDRIVIVIAERLVEEDDRIIMDNDDRARRFALKPPAREAHGNRQQAGNRTPTARSERPGLVFSQFSSRPRTI
jgi:hypothetical protein